jgi:hypothetical protein
LKSIGGSVSDTGVEVSEDQVSDTEKSIGCPALVKSDFINPIEKLLDLRTMVYQPCSSVDVLKSGYIALFPHTTFTLKL